MTTNASALFRMKDKRGAIGKGLAADIIATPENPLENIQALKKVAFVMKAGTSSSARTRSSRRASSSFVVVVFVVLT